MALTYRRQQQDALTQALLEQMMSNQQFQPQSYGAAAAKLGEAWILRNNRKKAEANAQAEQKGQNVALSELLDPNSNPGVLREVVTNQMRNDTSNEGAARRLAYLQSTGAIEQPLGQAIAQQSLEQMTPKPPEKIDVGGEYLFMQNGQVVGRIPKTPTPDARLNEAGSNYRHETPSGSSQLNEAGENRRHDSSQKSMMERFLIGEANQDERAKITAGRQEARQSQLLRKEFRSLPTVAAYETVLPIIQSAKNAPDNGFGDLQLIYSVGKALDPNSVVREGELALTIAANSPLQRIIGSTRFTTERGGRLPPKARQQIMGMLNERVKAYEQAYNRDRKIYSKYASDSGFEPVDIVGESPTKLISIPTGVDPAVWNAMTPEERSLWD